MGTWERRNTGGSLPPPHNSIGISCWRRSLKIQREIKREVFTHTYICSQNGTLKSKSDKIMCFLRFSILGEKIGIISTTNCRIIIN
jgi:hypothetical protein